MAKTTSLYLFNECVVDLEKAIGFAEDHGCDAIITHLTHQKYKREFQSTEKGISDRHLNFSRSDLTMSPSVWMNKIVAKLSKGVSGCDSTDSNIRKAAESMLLQEVSYANHCLSSSGTISLELRGTQTVNLARLLKGNILGMKID